MVVTQPNPIPGVRDVTRTLVLEVRRDNAPSEVVDGLIQDMVDRSAVGIQRYGRPLETFNGRDAAQDAYDEAVDLCKYLKQWEMELEDDGGDADVAFLRARAVELALALKAEILEREYRRMVADKARRRLARP